MYIYYITLSLIDNSNATPSYIGTAIKPISVAANVTEVDVLAIITKASSDSNIFDNNL